MAGWDSSGGIALVELPGWEWGCPSLLAVLGSRAQGIPWPQTQELLHSSTPGSSSRALAPNLWSQRQRKEVNALVLIAAAPAAAAECSP